MAQVAGVAALLITYYLHQGRMVRGDHKLAADVAAHIRNGAACSAGLTGVTCRAFLANETPQLYNPLLVSDPE